MNQSCCRKDELSQTGIRLQCGDIGPQSVVATLASPEHGLAAELWGRGLHNGGTMGV